MRKNLGVLMAMLIFVNLFSGCYIVPYNEDQNNQNQLSTIPFDFDEHFVYYSGFNQDSGKDEMYIVRYNPETKEKQQIKQDTYGYKFSIYNNKLYYIAKTIKNYAETSALFSDNINHLSMKEGSFLSAIPQYNQISYFKAQEDSIYFCASDGQHNLYNCLYQYEKGEINRLTDSIGSVNVYPDKIYYSDKDLNLHRIDLDGSNDRIILSGEKILSNISIEEKNKWADISMTNIVEHQEKIYFILKNVGSGKMYCFDGADVNVIINKNIKQYQIYKDQLYYISWELYNEGLFMCGLNGNDPKKIYDKVGDFCIANDKIYYYTVDLSSSFYQMNLDGTEQYLIE